MLSRMQRFVPALFLCLLTSLVAHSITPKRSPPRQEQRAAQAFNAAKKNPLQLRAFLAQMPKGADLHMHLSGAVYAET
ncbi:MAG: adenosine deaminase, partial [Edaphobacter sp.]